MTPSSRHSSGMGAVAAALVRRTCGTQGLAEKVTDPDVLRAVAVVLSSANETGSSGSRGARSIS